jgi:glycerol-3-phosphate dehydrogenase
MTTISRNPETAESEHYDIIIIGGGIYGAMLLLEAAQQNRRVLLVERHDFGAETSYNSLRIIHGGLRYLQTLDFVRFWESVKERQWLLATFPDLVKPMPCMMPLYNKGVKRPAVLKAAFLLNDLLSAQRNNNVPATNAIKNCRILNTTETRQLFPGVINDALTGSALWYDAHAPDTQRVIMETLLWACSLGAQAFNYVEATDILKSGNSVNGVRVSDRETGKTYEYRCNTVINATGPNGRKLSERFDQDVAKLYRPSLAWNIRFNCPTPSRYALALTPERPGATTYFLHPWKGRLFAGMWHEPYRGKISSHPVPDEKSIESFIDDMNQMLPDANLSTDNIEHIYTGYLPVTKEGGTKLTKRAVIYDHGRKGGPKGLYSITGVKFTTARKEAERILKYILGNINVTKTPRPNLTMASEITCAGYDWMPTAHDTSWRNDLKVLIKNESVIHIDDLIYRRTSIGDNPDRVRALTEDIAGLFEWDEQRKQLEKSTLMSKRTQIDEH